MPKQMKKATPEVVRNYVTERQDKEQRMGGGAIITGPDLALAAKHIDLIPDATLRRQVHGTLTTFEKFQALAMLLHPAGPYYKKHPELMDEIADAATYAERNATIEVPAGGFNAIKGGRAI